MTEWLFGPESMTWRINREAVLLVGGRAALLMQLAHPLVAAGVDQHSDFRSNGISRLRNTLDTMLGIIFGDVETAKAIAARVRAVHATVNGTAADGRSYTATDPSLLIWVWSTLVDSSVRVYTALVGPLTDEELDRYYEESVVVATMLGVPPEPIPESFAELRSWMKQMIDSGEIHVNDTARELAAQVLRPTRLVPSRLALAGAKIEAALLPRPIREGYGLKVGRPSSVVLRAGRVATQKALPLMPERLRLWPAARAAQPRG